MDIKTVFKNETNKKHNTIQEAYRSPKRQKKKLSTASYIQDAKNTKQRNNRKS